MKNIYIYTLLQIANSLFCKNNTNSGSNVMQAFRSNNMFFT